MVWNLQIFKVLITTMQIFGFGLTGLLKLLIGVQIVKLINEKEENLTEEDKEANAILRFIFFLLSFSMAMCIVHEVTGEYHYALCGPNLFSKPTFIQLLDQLYYLLCLSIVLFGSSFETCLSSAAYFGYFITS